MGGFGRWLAFPALALAFLAASASANPADPFPEPEALRPAVAFWMRVYLESTTDGGFLHDAEHLGVVYELVRFEGETDRRRRERIVDSRKDAWRDTLDRFALGGEPRDDTERQVVAAWRQALGREPEMRDWKLAKTNLRFQLGQRDKFREGLIRSGAYEDEMRAIFRDMGLPEDLAYLPHVESSFNVRAYSKYGAAGVWQFMRGTGRRFMKVDYVIDERLDPVTATHAAGRLLRENYELLGTWPLALTAYNHGAAGMNRAVAQVGSRKIEEIVAHYESRTFGFASRNFYAQFLAARRVMREYESYFGPVEREAPNVVDVVPMPFYANVSDLERDLGVSRQTLAELNPALRPPVFRSGKRIPKGYPLRLPAGTVKGDTATWLAAVPPAQRHAEQHENRYYTVRRGDTLGRIAARHGTSVSALVAENDIGKRHRIYPGQVLQIPDRGARSEPEPPMSLVSEAMAATRPAAVPPAPKPAPAPPALAPAPAEAPAEAPTVANAEPPAPPEAEPEAEPEAVAETEIVVADVAPVPAPVPDVDDADEEPGPEGDALVDDEPAEVAPALGPTPEAQVLLESEPEVAAVVVPLPATPDDSPFRRIDRERVIVDADETLGHFAEWLEVPSQRLRNLNKLKRRRPIEIGQTLRLDFSKVSPEVFQQRRLEYHKGIEEDFFGSFRVTDTLEHTLRRGETLWTLSHKTYAVPTWLIHRYNPDLDLAKLVPGTRLVIPIVEKSS